MDEENVRRRTHVQPVTARRPGNEKMHPRDACRLPVQPEITPALVAEIEAALKAGDFERIDTLLLWTKSHWLRVLLRNCLSGQSCEDCPYPPGWNPNYGCPRGCSRAEDPGC